MWILYNENVNFSDKLTMLIYIYLLSNNSTLTGLKVLDVDSVQ